MEWELRIHLTNSIDFFERKQRSRIQTDFTDFLYFDDFTTI